MKAFTNLQIQTFGLIPKLTQIATIQSMKLSSLMVNGVTKERRVDRVKLF